MANEYLPTYLNDHLAGSIAAVDLLEHLEAAYKQTELASFFAELRSEIQADRRELQDLMGRLQIAQSRPRKLSAWITGKVTEFKLRLDDSARGSLRLLESLEVVGLGIHGKLALWRALSAAAASSPVLQGFDYERLAQRAEEQRCRVEVVRLEAAKAAFTDRNEVNYITPSAGVVTRE
jgi:hypothetical protein